MKRRSLWVGLFYPLTAGQAWALDGRCNSPSLSGSLIKDAPLLLVTGIVVGVIAAALWALVIRLIRIGSHGRRCKANPRLLRVGVVAAIVWIVLAEWLFWQLQSACF